MRKVLKIIVCIVCIIAVWYIVSKKNVEHYNKQFLQYEKNVTSYWNTPDEYIASDIEGLINTAIKNNKNGRKITLIYENTNYTSVDELKQLLSKLNTSESYLMVIRYDDGGFDYISSIKLSTFVNERLTELYRLF